MDRLDDDRYTATNWAGRQAGRPSGPERRAEAAVSRRGMSAGAWIGFAVGLCCVAVVAAFARWSSWWPHSDNRQNGVTLFGTVAGALAAVTLARAFVAVKSRAARVWMVVGAVAAAVLGWSVGYALMVDATRWAK